MKNLKEYMLEGQKHEAKRKNENRKMLRAGGELARLAQQLSVEGSMEYEKAFEVVCEQNPELATAYFPGLHHAEHRARTYERKG
jgi:hypothetical protein